MAPGFNRWLLFWVMLGISVVVCISVLIHRATQPPTIDEGIQMLNSADPEVRHRSIMKFAEHEEARMVGPLVRVALCDLDYRIADEAVMYLMHYDHPSVSRTCEKYITHLNPCQLGNVADMLSFKSDQLSYTLLKRLALDEDPEVSKLAFGGLRTTGTDADTTINFLRQQLLDGPEARALWAGLALPCGKYCKESLRLLPELERALQDTSLSPLRRKAIQRTVASMKEFMARGS